MLPNPNACWDWVGWYGNNADQKGGKSFTFSEVSKLYANGSQGLICRLLSARSTRLWARRSPGSTSVHSVDASYSQETFSRTHMAGI